MKAAWCIILLTAALLAGAPGQARAPATSPRPVARPAADPAAGVDAVVAEIVVASATPASLALAVSPLPVPRPPSDTEVRSANYSRNGSVCGMREIRGEPVAAIKGRMSGCGIAQPVRVIEVSGVKLSQPVIVDCDTARALNRWVVKGIKPAVKRKGGGLVGLKVLASYACRTRNSQPGARISEHAKGHAVDVGALIMKNGQVVTVQEGWGDRKWSKVLKKIFKSACGPFGTVLGPNANRFHRDHFHVDTASYRSGPYCR